jgi:Kef-type K+ transport system membrane component KefB
MDHHHPLLIVLLIAVLAPLISELPMRFRIPGVVLEIAGGILVGPHVLGLVRGEERSLEVLSLIGMSFLFLLAGMEIDFSRLRGRPLRLAGVAWLVSLALALGVAQGLVGLGLTLPPLLVAIALTTTALGVLLPILRDAGELSRPFGLLVLAAGAMGEFGPLLMLSMLPIEGHIILPQVLVIAGFTLIAVLAAVLVLRVQPPRFVDVLRRTLHKTSQLPVRLVVLLVGILVVIAFELGLEILIGAFAAGMIVGTVTRGEEAEPFHHKLDGLGFGFVIPIFFVVTGVRFDLNALLGSTTSLLCLPLFLVLFLLVRGLPTLLYHRELSRRDQLALAFCSAPALPIVVAITQVGVATHQMTTDIAAALIGAGMISLLVFPQVAMALRAQAQAGPVTQAYPSSPAALSAPSLSGHTSGPSPG